LGTLGERRKEGFGRRVLFKVLKESVLQRESWGGNKKGVCGGRRLLMESFGFQHKGRLF